MTSEIRSNNREGSQDDPGIKRRGLLRFGTLATAITGASAMSAVSAKSAQAGPSDKTPSNTYVPIAEKGSPSGVASLDTDAKVLLTQLPDFSATYGGGSERAREAPGSVVNKEFVPGDARRYGWETDPNRAATSIRELITSQTGRVTGTVRLLDDVVTVPAGTWTITEIGALLKGVPTDGRRHRGLILRGMGRDTTTIVFDPVEDGFLIDNQDRMSRITLRDITFVGGSTKASFMNSVSNGGPKSLVVERCTWSGTWKYGFHLTGTDTNSEFIFYGVKANGYYDTFFRCDNVQALNHHWIGCDIELANGNGLDYINGGHINIIGGSWIININNPLLDGTGTLIKLGTSGAAPVNRLYVEGIRVEHRSLGGKLIDCGWTTGTIKFNSVHDVGYQANSLAQSQAVVRAVFRGINPTIVFDNCRLSGKHEYVTSSQEDNARRNVLYRDTIIEHWARLDQFIVNSNTSGRAGAVVPVRFENCRPGVAVTPLGTGATVYDQTVNALVSKNSVLKRHTVSLKNFSGGLPGTGSAIPVTLPLNAIVISLRAYAPAGATSTVSSTWSYALNDSQGNELTTIRGSTGQNMGFNIKNDVFIPLDTEEKRVMTVMPGPSTGGTNSAGLMILEYLS